MISIPDPRPQFPEHIAVSAPIGTREKIRSAAQRAGISSAAFIREAIAGHLRHAVPTSQGGA